MCYQDPDVEFVAHSLEDKVNLELIQLLDSMHCPDEGMNRVLKWANKAKQLGFDFQPKITTRKAQIEHFYSTFDLHRFKPKIKTVRMLTASIDLPDEIDVVYFDFADMLISMFEDPVVMASENLLVNQEDFRKPYEGPKRIGEGITALWYKATCAQLRKSEKDFVVPIKMFTDKTHITENERYTLDPVHFVMGILKNETQNKKAAWRPLGFKQSLSMSKAQAAKERKDQHPAKNLQAQMKVILRSFIQCQQQGPGNKLHDVELKIGDQTRVCNIIPVLMTIEADGQEKDRLCGRFLSYTIKVSRISSYCNQYTDDCDSFTKLCTPYQQSKMKQLIQSAEHIDDLKDHSMSKCDNSFWNVNFGANPGGIYTACAPDLLHQFEHGMGDHVPKVILHENLTEGKRNMIDNVVMHYTKTMFRQTCARDYFRVQFKKGITNLTKITAGERMGVMFTMFCVLSISSVQEELESVWANDDYMDLIQTLEMILCCHSYLRQDTFWECPDLPTPQDIEKNHVEHSEGYCTYYKCKEEEECLRAFEKMLRYIKKTVPRKKNQL
jgi:hypothetical protein